MSCDVQNVFLVAKSWNFYRLVGALSASFQFPSSYLCTVFAWICTLTFYHSLTWRRLSNGVVHFRVESERSKMFVRALGQHPSGTATRSQTQHVQVQKAGGRKIQGVTKTCHPSLCSKAVSHTRFSQSLVDIGKPLGHFPARRA